MTGEFSVVLRRKRSHYKHFSHQLTLFLCVVVPAGGALLVNNYMSSAYAASAASNAAAAASGPRASVTDGNVVVGGQLDLQYACGTGSGSTDAIGYVAGGHAGYHGFSVSKTRSPPLKAKSVVSVSVKLRMCCPSE